MKHSLNLYLDGKLIEELKKAALEKGISVSKLITELFQQYTQLRR